MQTKSRLALTLMVALAASGGVLFAVIASNPARLGPGGVTLWFIALLVGLAGLITGALYFWSAHRPTELSHKQLYSSALRQGVLIGGGVTVLLALSSLRQLALRDAVLIIIFLLLVEFYFRTRQ